MKLPIVVLATSRSKKLKGYMTCIEYIKMATDILFSLGLYKITKAKP